MARHLAPIAPPPLARPERLVFARLGSPFGELVAVATSRGIARLVFPEEDSQSAIEDVALELSTSPIEDLAALGVFAHEIDEYFSGRRRRFDTRADLSLVRGFARLVLRAAEAIPYGAVATYGEMASRAGSPRGARAAGNAMRVNPVPILVPCHRVVPADGGIGGYGGHEDRKAFLLELEAARGIGPDDFRGGAR